MRRHTQLTTSPLNHQAPGMKSVITYAPAYETHHIVTTQAISHTQRTERACPDIHDLLVRHPTDQHHRPTHQSRMHRHTQLTASPMPKPIPMHNAPSAHALACMTRYIVATQAVSTPNVRIVHAPAYTIRHASAHSMASSSVHSAKGHIDAVHCVSQSSHNGPLTNSIS